MEKQARSTGEILHQINTRTKDKAIVDSSARLHERRNGKHLGNAEAKLGVYAARVEALLLGERTKLRLQDKIAQNFAIRPQDVPDTYWQNQEQFARAKGDYLHLNEYQKKFAINNIRDTQITGIRRWINQLNGEENPYPTWFKLYAIDGLSHMGRFDPKAGLYRTRSKSTTAPYPYLDTDALRQTFAVTQAVYEQNSTLEDEQLDALVRGGNFNKIYSYFMLQNSSHLEVPDNPADVQGQWREYNPFMVNELIDASQGTYWCTAGEEMASYYLQDQSHRFYIFHLEDPQTGQISPTGSAAIHLECGFVDEVVGQQDQSQAIHPVLQSTVNDMLRTLPGGEYYSLSMADNELLNFMDEKFQLGVDFTTEELLFLYEVNRKILFKTNRSSDVRINDFKQYRTTHQLQLETIYPNDAHWMVMESHEVASRLSSLVRKGAEIEWLVKKLAPCDVIAVYDTLIELGATIDVDQFIEGLNRREFNRHLEWISEHASPEALLRHVIVIQHNNNSTTI